MRCKELKECVILKKKKTDIYFMDLALKEAEKAAVHDEVPVGAIVVDERGEVIGRGYNQTIKKKTPLAHAESEAMRKAARRLRDWRLDGCTLYVTLEPCTLCMQLISMSRIARLVYGADSLLYGFSRDAICTFDLARLPLIIEKGVEKDSTERLLKQFFKKKRRRFDGAKNGSRKGKEEAA
jgi:tRNA(adenine34) deaminase